MRLSVCVVLSAAVAVRRCLSSPPSLRLSLSPSLSLSLSLSLPLCVFTPNSGALLPVLACYVLGAVQ
eukprot:SAG11_NODE_20415_length_445_cov_4.367052_2_plen_66_part_01